MNPAAEITTFTQSLTAIQHQMATVWRASQLAHGEPIVIAVSKQQPLAKIEAALASGHRHFGENRIQDAKSIWPGLKKRYPDVVLHLIGSLQTNKAADAVELFDIIHTVDRVSVVDALLVEINRQNRFPLCLVQVNTGEEPQKSGVTPRQLSDLLHYCCEKALKISGLMCIPPADIPPAPHFAFLHKLAKQYELPELSMGMSGDYELAARFGATYVRIGTALFGERF